MIVKQITTTEELEAAFTIRKAVFVEEQHVPLVDEFDEFDRLDAPCNHILIYHNNKAVGTGRIRIVDGDGKLERICLLANCRSLGFGKVIIDALEAIAKEQNLAQVKLHGQTHAEGFYKKLGYETASPVFMEDGIPHVLMRKLIQGGL